MQNKTQRIQRLLEDVVSAVLEPKASYVSVKESRDQVVDWLQDYETNKLTDSEFLELVKENKDLFDVQLAHKMAIARTAVSLAELLKDYYNIVNVWEEGAIKISADKAAKMNPETIATMASKADVVIENKDSNLEYGKELRKISSEPDSMTSREFIEYITDYLESPDKYGIDTDSEYWEALEWAKNNPFTAYQAMKDATYLQEKEVEVAEPEVDIPTRPETKPKPSTKPFRPGKISPEEHPKPKALQINEGEDETGLMVYPSTEEDRAKIEEMIGDEEWFHAEWHKEGGARGYFLFPEKEETYDALETQLEQDFGRLGIDASFEGIFNDDKDLKESEKYLSKEEIESIVDALPIVDGERFAKTYNGLYKRLKTLETKKGPFLYAQYSMSGADSIDEFKDAWENNGYEGADKVDEPDEIILIFKDKTGLRISAWPE